MASDGATGERAREEAPLALNWDRIALGATIRAAREGLTLEEACAAAVAFEQRLVPKLNRWRGSAR